MAEYRYVGQCAPAYGGCGQRLSITLPVEKGVHWVNCPECSKRAMLKKVEGEFNPDHKCDVRCTSAKGHTCRCACGGANHGADWGIQEVVAVQSSAPRQAPVGGHLGEVGKTIVQPVTVQSVRQNIGSTNSTLYTFVTDVGDTLKWFAPSYADPCWLVGEKFTLRAKVKAHETHEKFGKSTIIIYAEQIGE